MRVRIKELAQEAKYIRHEEYKIKSKQKIILPVNATYENKYTRTETDKNSNDFLKLRFHRTYDVRMAARAAQLAYGFLRDVPYRRIEPKTNTGLYEKMKIHKEVKRLANKFGYSNYDKEVDIWFSDDTV